MSTQLVTEALAALNGGGAILDVAREVSTILRDENLNGAVIGGVATLLHGHVRTTVDVDVFIDEPQPFARSLEAAGFEFDAANRQFMRRDVPVHLVTLAQVRVAPSHFQDIDGIRTVSLADLINLKLRSGTSSVLRSQDIADVVGLIRHHRLTGEFTARIDPALRPEFRNLVQAVERE